MLQADPSKVSSRAKKRGLPQVGMGLYSANINNLLFYISVQHMKQI